jgi:LuxR family maltose regulon positive regulatory protein
LLTGALHHWTGEQSNYSDEQARADLDQVEIYDGWFDIFAAGVVVEAYGLKRPRDAVSRARRIAERRGLPRLSRFADAVQIGLADDPGRGTISAKLAQQLPKAIWREQPFWWSPYLESRLALGWYYAGIDRSRAIESMNEAAECAEHFGANLHLVRILIARALLHDLSGQRDRAVDDLTEALSLAAPENMVGPFLGKKGMVPLLRAVIRHAQEAYIDILVIEFAGSLISRSSRFGDGSDEASNVAGLSIREREVLDELANGRSNKEIARLLDMTEHTVKFHLKNIFVKLGAERRTEAVANAMRLRLI